MRHPAEDVGIAAKLRKRVNRGVMAVEIAQEIADGSAVVANRFGIERGTEGRDSAVEAISQWMLKGRSPCAVHDTFPGSGRMCWATARVYSTYTSCGVT